MPQREWAKALFVNKILIFFYLRYLGHPVQFDAEKRGDLIGNDHPRVHLISGFKIGGDDKVHLRRGYLRQVQRRSKKIPGVVKGSWQKSFESERVCFHTVTNVK